MKRLGLLSVCLVGMLPIVSGCHQDMYDQPRVNPLASSDLFEDGSAARVPPEGTVATNDYVADKLFADGLENGGLATRFPYPVTKAMLERGRSRYNVFCLPCHGEAGFGDGMIVQRGYAQPKSFHLEELRAKVPGYYYRVMVEGTERLTGRPFLTPNAKTVGEGDMVHPVLGKNMKIEDRWAIVAYIYALQKSQRVPRTELSPSDLEQLSRPAEQGGFNGGH
ncbi:MAG: quinol:cytochrome C oxidoreductase [Armatimonadota bacterium]